MKFKIKNGLILLFLIVFTVFLAPASKASCIPDPPDKYRIDFESYYSYSKITWKYTDINHTLVENLVNESFCSPDLLETEKNDYIHWEVSLFNDVGSIWEIQIKDPGIRYYYHTTLWKLPKNFAEACYSSSSMRYTMKIIPYNVPEYLNEVRNYIPINETQNIQIGSYSIKEDFRTNDTHGHKVYNYDINGILDQYSVYYDNQTAYDLKLSYYEHFIDDYQCNCGSDPFFWLMVTIIGISGFIFFVLMVSYVGMGISYEHKREILKREGVWI